MSAPRFGSLFDIEDAARAAAGSVVRRSLDLLSTPPAEAAVWLLFRATHVPTTPRRTA